MGKHAKKKLTMVLATAMAASPALLPAKAFAMTDVNVTADDYETDTETTYTIEFTPEEKLKSGDKITIKFDSHFDLDNVDEEGDVELNGDTADNVDIDTTTNTVVITLEETINSGDDVTIDIDNVRNPGDEDTYLVKVKTSQETSYESDSVNIKDNGSNSNNGDFDVDIDDDQAGEETSYSLGTIDLKDDLETGSYIYVRFPTDDMLPSSIDETDVEINGHHPSDVQVTNDDEVRLKVPSSVSGEDRLDIDFSDNAGIQNPEDAADDYTITVEYKNEEYESAPFEIVDDNSSSSTSRFSVSLSDYNAGARSSYSFEVDLGRKKLGSYQTITVVFPSSDMMPLLMNTNAITINGYQPRSVSFSGTRVTLTTPYGFTSTSRPRINFGLDANLTNPRTAGSYQLSVIYDDKTYYSNSFTITGSAVTNPVPVDNSMATLSLTKTAPSAATGMQVGIKGLGVPLVKNRDFIELALPAGFRVPAVIDPSAISVNGIPAGYVASRGQNLVIYPAYDVLAGTPVTITLGETSGIVTPAQPGTYTVGVYSSEEKNALFSRAVTIAAPASSPRLKIGVASFTMNGKSYALAAAPYTLNGYTMVPATFYKDGLGYTVYWNKSQATLISGRTVIKFTVGSSQALVNNAAVKLPVVVQAKNNVPMLPLRFIADTLKFRLSWDAATSSIVVSK